MASEARTDEGREQGRDRGAGQALVRLHLIDPLAGLDRRKGQSVADHERELARLAERLSYLPELELRGLAQLVLRHAGVVGKGWPQWPPMELIVAWAHALQPPPPRTGEYVRSLLMSRLGALARDGGWMIELYRAAVRFGPPPPSAYAIGKLKDEARENRAMLDRIHERTEAGMQTADDAAWLAAWHRDWREAHAMVVAGDNWRNWRQCERAAKQVDRARRRDGWGT